MVVTKLVVPVRGDRARAAGGGAVGAAGARTGLGVLAGDDGGAGLGVDAELDGARGVGGVAGAGEGLDDPGVDGGHGRDSSGRGRGGRGRGGEEGDEDGGVLYFDCGVGGWSWGGCLFG